MEKDPPPPYSTDGVYPQPGFHVPPNQPPINQQPLNQPGYPGQPGYPQQPGYPTQPGYVAGQPMQQGNTTVVVTTIPVLAQYGPTPQPITCPHCHNPITTRLETEAGMRTHLIALLLCIIGCIPCCLIPYCVDSCQNRNHYCPSCGAFLGSYDSDGLAMRNRW